MTATAAGLEGVVAFATRIAEPDRDGGALRYRGVDVEDLAGRVPFERVWGLVVDGTSPAGSRPSRPGGRRRARATREPTCRRPSPRWRRAGACGRCSTATRPAPARTWPGSRQRPWSWPRTPVARPGRRRCPSARSRTRPPRPSASSCG